MSRAISSGLIAGTEKRSAANTTPTSLDEFATETLASAYATV